MSTPRTVAPPPRKAAPIKAVPSEPPPKNAHDRRVAELLDGAGSIAAVLTLTSATRPDAAAIVAHAPGIAEGAAKWADANENVARLLDKITTMGPASAFVAAVVGLGVQIAVNHKFLPPGFLGAVDPDTLVRSVIGGDDDNTDSPGSESA